MERPNPAAQPRTLDELRRRIDQWRLTRRHRRPMPEDLWQQAAKIARVQGINPTASALRLNYYSLKERTEDLPKEGAGPPRAPGFGGVEGSAGVLPCQRMRGEVESKGEK